MVAKHLDRQYRNVATKQNKNARIILKSSDKNNRLDSSSISSFFLAFDSLWFTPSFQVECHRIPVTTVFVPILLVCGKGARPRAQSCTSFTIIAGSRQ